MNRETTKLVKTQGQMRICTSGEMREGIAARFTQILDDMPGA